MRELGADLVDERRRRIALEREVRELRSQVAELKACEAERRAPAHP
jgi:hypothetical protein